MSNPYAAYQTDTNLETSGIWLIEPSFRVKIARAGGSNTAYSTRLNALVKPHKRAIQLNMLAKEVDDELTRQLFVDTVILQWDTVDAAKSKPGEPAYVTNTIHDFPTGKVVAYDKTVAMKVLANLPELMRYINNQASDPTLFQAQDEETTEADEKN